MVSLKIKSEVHLINRIIIWGFKVIGNRDCIYSKFFSEQPWPKLYFKKKIGCNLDSQLPLKTCIIIGLLKYFLTSDLNLRLTIFHHTVNDNIFRKSSLCSIRIISYYYFLFHPQGVIWP